jgi:protein O-GlcNAc transferase
MKPQVTIGVPVHNESKYLRQTLASICRQTYPDIQVIVSNNGSVDNSREIIGEFADRDPRFTVYDQKVTLDAVDNVRFLLEKATTPYFMWLGGHDFISERFVELCVTELENRPGSALASGRIYWQKETDGLYLDCNEALNTFHMPPRVAVLTWLWSFFSCFQFYGVYRTAILREVGMPSFYSPDVALVACVLLRGSAVFCGDAVYYATRNRPDESVKAQIRRYAGLGLSEADLAYVECPKARMGRFFKPCRDHILAAIWMSGMPLRDRIWAIVEIKRVFKERLNYLIP